MNSLTRRVLTAAALIPIVLGLILFAPGWLFLLGLAPVVYLGLWEYLELVGRIGPSRSRLPVYGIGLALLVVGYMIPSQLLAGVIASALLLLTFEMLQRPALAELLPASAAGILGVLYVAAPLTLALRLHATEKGPWILLLLLLLVWAGDIAAYFVGRAIGRHKLAPKISPGKTIEGTVASLLAAMGLGYWLFRLWFPEHRMLHALFFPLCVNVLAQIGDLAESALKRGADVKDSSSLLPGHGGVLDRIDSLLFAIPAAWYYWSWLP